MATCRGIWGRSTLSLTFQVAGLCGRLSPIAWLCHLSDCQLSAAELFRLPPPGSGILYRSTSSRQQHSSSDVVKDLRLKDEDKDNESSFKDKEKDLMSKDEDLKIGPRGQGLSSRTTHRVSNKCPGLLEIQSCQSTSRTLVTS